MLQRRWKVKSLPNFVDEVGRKILQENMRWKALAEIYTMHCFAPFSMLKILFKIAEKIANFSPNFAKNLI